MNLALRLMPNSTESYSGGALALARAGDFRRVEELLKETTKRYPPRPTLFNNFTLPSVRAAIALGRKKPAEAIEELRRTVSYDLTSPADAPSGITMYYRGLAYLELHSGNEAAAQFQKILDHPGVVSVEIFRLWPISDLLALTPSRGTKIRVSLNIGIFWHFGKMRTPIFGFSTGPRPNTQTK
jgi:tetratricopeptide (TPR) repeat protein